MVSELFKKSMHQEQQNKVLITLAVAPSGCVSGHCISLAGGGTLGSVVSFNELSSVFDTLFSALAKSMTNNVKEETTCKI